MKRVITVAAILAVGSIQAAYAADSVANMPGMKMTEAPAINPKDMQASHQMTGIVTALDSKTGMIEINAEGMPLKLHFPPATLGGVKVGDKIAVQLAFKKL